MKEKRGVCIVDVTRRGKKWPDALGRSVPMWCCVVNLLGGFGGDVERGIVGIGREGRGCELDWRVVERMGVVVRREVEVWRKVDVCWREVLGGRELRVVFLKGGERVEEGVWWGDGNGGEFMPVVCVTGSLGIGGDGREGRRFCEGRNEECEVMGVRFAICEGFEYVQGAGDDEEVWAMGLTPRSFWEHREWILGGGEVECEDRVRRLVQGLGPVERPRTTTAERKSLWKVCDFAKSALGLWLSTEGVTSTLKMQLSFLEPTVLISLGFTPAITEKESNGSICGKFQSKDAQCAEKPGPIDQHCPDKGSTKSLFYPCLNYHHKVDYKHGFQRNLREILACIGTCSETRNVIVTDDANTRGDWAAGVAIAWLAWCEMRKSNAIEPLGKDILRQLGFKVSKACPEVSLGRTMMKQLNRFFFSKGPYTCICST